MGLLDRLGRFIDDVLLLPDDVRDALTVAESALEAEMYAEAERLYLDVLAGRPTLVRAAVGLAHARERLGDAAGARTALLEARELAPDVGSLALFTARFGIAHGDFALAADAARDAVRAYTREGGAPLAESYALRAKAEQGRGRPDRAARELQKAAAVEPTNPEHRIALVEALCDAGQQPTARSAARSIDTAALTGSQAYRVGRALGAAGVTDAATSFLEAAAARGHVPALLELARALLRAANPDAAEARARDAVARGGGPEALRALGEVLVSLRRGAEAAEVFAEAARLAPDVDLVRAAVRTAPVTDVAGLSRHVDALSEMAPGDAAVSAARAFVRLARGDLDGAESELASARGSDEPRALLARAEVALRRSRAAEALEAVERFEALAESSAWAAADQRLAADLRRRALRELWRGDGGEVDLAGAIDAVERFGRDHGLADVERGARDLRDELDRPLVLAVLGEFNAGKSTLINAFIGAEVAPMGIVPTTATLNLLRSGGERRVRVVRLDGTTREGVYEDLRAILDEVDHDAIDRVEIMLPGETLEKVWILDAPGTNALDPAHERLAREAARRADAVLWVYDAGQAGKRTEGEMQTAIARAGRVIVPVLNKSDRFSDAERVRVERALVEAFPRLPAPLWVSAKSALRARVAGDAAEVEASGYGALLEHLERTVFGRSRELKRRACAGRLLSLLDGALTTEAEAVERYDRDIARLNATGGRLIALGRGLAEAVDDKVRWLEIARQTAFVEAAEEVLSFVRPRRHQFARHGADPADRSFLRDVLERRIGAAIQECEATLVDVALVQVTAAIDRTPAVPPRAIALADPLAARVRLAVAGPIAQFWGYQRGLFAAGALHRFFDDVLPVANLERETLANALAGACADPSEQLRPMLREAMGELVQELEGARARAAEEKARERARISDRVYGPLRALRQVLSDLSRFVEGPVDDGSH